MSLTIDEFNRRGVNIWRDDCPSRLCPVCFDKGIRVPLDTWGYMSPRDYIEEHDITGEQYWDGYEIQLQHEKSHGDVCPECGFKENSYEQRMRLDEIYRIAYEKEKKKTLEGEGVDSELRYYCSMCRCNHKVSSDMGFVHRHLRNETIGNTGECVVCSSPLNPPKRKFCSDECIERNKYTCKKCGRYWKADRISFGSITRGFCGACDWSDYTDSFRKVMSQLGTRDDYRKLELNSDATEEEIKKRYRELAKEHHPDLGGDEERMKEINLAFENIMKSR